MEQLCQNSPKGRKLQTKYKSHMEDYTKLKRDLDRASLMGTAVAITYGTDDAAVCFIA
jgi:hypothetical protein